MQYQKKLETIAIQSWEILTFNGIGLNADDISQSIKSARDAACNVYQDGISDAEWITATINRLNGAN